jgi:hypothetical protein
MKYWAISLMSIGLIMAGLWYAFGGMALAVTLVTFISVLLLMLAFGLGSWWSGRLMERGAKIVLKAQTSDDRRDIDQVQALAGLMKETVRNNNSFAYRPQYPSLPVNEEAAEIQFTIAGLEEDS